MAVAPDPVAAEVGRDVLRRGGRAADAAVAIAFALSVTDPMAGSLGGGGFALVRSGAGATVALDFRETAPAALMPEHFLDSEGRPVPARATDSGLSVGVPGLVAGLWALHREHGSLPWSGLLAPAIRLAEEGFPLPRFQAEALASAADRLRRRDASRGLFFRPDGTPLREGDRLVQRDLARTLRRIAAEGPRAFYEGQLAERIARTVREEGGVLTQDDLRGYRPVARAPLAGSYRGHTVETFPPPSGGGIALLAILGMLDRFDLASSGPYSSATVHRMVEAERRAFADRARALGDPAFVEVPVDRLLDPARIAELARGIDDARATPSASLSGFSGTGGGETLHFTVADARSNVVAATISLNLWFGSGIVVPGTGVLLNNQIADFSLARGVPDPYGLVGGDANAVAGGKRPVSSMTPTLVLAPGNTPRPRLALGSPGGPTIITSVAQVVSRVVDHGMSLQEAVDSPRFHHQGIPDRIDHEKNAFSKDTAEALLRLGHLLREREPIGSVQALAWNPSRNEWEGAADPRRDGAARGY
jgi:gamma-glutamyltranspeptidase/glutathione hydrolase